MFPLQRLPNSNPISGKTIEACFQDGRRPILGPRPKSRKRYSRKQRRSFFQKNGEYYDIPFEFQRDSWRKLLKKIRKWEKLEPQDYMEWWPISHEVVSTWFNTLAKLPPTQDGESVKGDINVCLHLQRCPSLKMT